MSKIKTQFTLRLDLVIHAKAKRLAKLKLRSLTNFIEYLLKEEINKFEMDNGEIILSEEDLSIE